MPGVVSGGAGSLSPDLLVSVLTRLPLPALLTARQVDTSWRQAAEACPAWLDRRLVISTENCSVVFPLLSPRLSTVRYVRLVGVEQHPVEAGLRAQLLQSVLDLLPLHTLNMDRFPLSDLQEQLLGDTPRHLTR